MRLTVFGKQLCSVPQGCQRSLQIPLLLQNHAQLAAVAAKTMASTDKS